jgi:TonB-dependent SusC/RagA subfamily outer membrane receptor
LTGTQFILKTLSSAGKNGILTMDIPVPGAIITPGNLIDSKYNANADILESQQGYQKHGVMTASNGPTKLLLKEDKIVGVKRNNSYRSSNLGGPGHADQVILGDQIANAPTISSAINGLAHGLLFNSGVPSLATGMTISGSGGGSQGLEPMLVIVDGVNLGRGVNIDNFSPTSVEAVEILKGANASIYGVEGGQGVMVITTRQGGLNDQIVSKEMSPGIFSFEPQGFYKAREFYSPRYDANQPSGNLPDQRTTIFWKPDVSTDAEGNASFNFSNADGIGTYRVEIEGFDTKGNLGRQVYHYKVQ